MVLRPGASPRKYVGEHRLIAEEALGKPLPEGAVVHHLSGDKQDNRRSNLLVCENERYHQLIHARQRRSSCADPLPEDDEAGDQ